MSTDKALEHHHAHHFRDGDHEFETAKHGVWLFLVTEILMFGGLFVAYFIFRNKHPEIFLEGSKFLDWKMGAVNTVVLIFSSFTMALGIYYSQKAQQAKAVLALWTTFACGIIFMIIKYFEYSHKLHLGLKPGAFFHYDQAESPLLHLYFSFYYLMTGMHGLHVLIGMSLIAWVAIRAMKGEFGPKYYTPVEGVGLFWHLVDLVWIYLFPLLYLMH